MIDTTSVSNLFHKLLPVKQVPPTMYPLASLSINSVDLATMLTFPFPPNESLLDPWLPVRGLAMAYAPRGIGKTQFCMDVGFAVATGGTFLKWSAPKPRGVLYLDGEMPGKVLQDRFRDIVNANGVSIENVPMQIITPDLHPEGMINLSSPAHQRLLETHLDGVELIIVDNVATLCRSGRENEAESWMSVQQWAIGQRSKGRTVLFVHHAGKSGEQRGTSAREDVLDTVISLKRPDGYSPVQGAVFEVQFEKARRICGAAAESFLATLTYDENGKRTWLCSGMTEDTYSQIVQIHRQEPTIKQIEIARRIGVDKATVSRHIGTARQKGDL